MTDPIVRVYESEQQARAAAHRLEEEGFSPNDVFLLTPISGEGPVAPGALSGALLAGQALGKQARRCAASLEEGRSVVAIRPPYGYAQLAINILADYGPRETEARPPQRSSTAWDEAAPLSSALQLRTIKRNQPAPFSALLGLETLASGRSALSKIFGELTSPDFALFGRSHPVYEAAPLSSFFHLKTLTRSEGPWRSSLGLPLLTRNPAPLSSGLGLLTSTGGPLREHPAPFSAVLGFPTRSSGRTFLSRLFGELASPHFALFGRSSLSRKAAPLSSLVGLKTLSGRSGPSWRRSLGVPMLTKGSPTSLGLPLLARNPAPLSTLFGLRVLSPYQ